MCTLTFHVVALVTLAPPSLLVVEDIGNFSVCVRLVEGILQRNITALLSSRDITAVGKKSY